MKSALYRCVLVAGTAIAAAWAVRRASLRWGADAGELTMPLPGDGWLPAPDLQATRAITIKAPRSHVWGWVAQLGQNRGGFYTYDWLENLAGCDIHSSDVVMPELRVRAVGDEVRLAPSVGLRVVDLEETHHLVLRGAVAGDGTTAPAPYDFTWAFVLTEDAPGVTRLIVRERYAYLAGWARLLAEPVEMVSFLMSQRMLRGIRERAERRTATGA
ncbi:SRPBCC family protein [Promicromonospora sp. NPDC060271]|uniref:SRPBCC family protein n=1 Tax=Promicromonospora sp. NPDC060271 TaxID=3347089 RepID=UPI003654E8A8